MQLHTSTVNPSLTVSEIVRSDYRTADVFKRYGINYCCGGNFPLQEACVQKGLNLQEVEAALQQAIASITLSNNIQYGQWKPDFLIDYIINIHHAYLYQTLPALQAVLISFIEGHKKKYPELVSVQTIFMALADSLQVHIQNEDATIFPYLKQIINTYRRKESYGSLFVKTMRKPLNEIIQKEHKQITDLLMQLRVAARSYAIPDGACTNYQVILHKLKELDNDLVQHKHLENNILFPKVMDMEKELLQL